MNIKKTCWEFYQKREREREREREKGRGGEIIIKMVPRVGRKECGSGHHNKL
jgi:hypothetical protein